MIVFAALTPHSPLLLPSINKKQLNKVAKTRQAMGRLEEELYLSRPDTVVIFSSHAIMFDRAFSLNLHDQYRVDLSEFGDLATSRTFLPDLWLIDKLQRSLRAAKFPLTLSSDVNLDYGAALPLLLLAEHLPEVKIVPIAFSALPAKDHWQFGDALKDTLINCPQRVAVIGSGDQSHALSTDSPAGFAEEGLEFDRAVRAAIENRNSASLITIDPQLVESARECSYRPLLMLMGLLERVNYRPVIHSYEAPFGVGYLVAHFEIQ